MKNKIKKVNLPGLSFCQAYCCFFVYFLICFLFPGEPPVCAVPVVTENPLPKDALSSTGKP